MSYRSLPFGFVALAVAGVVIAGCEGQRLFHAAPDSSSAPTAAPATETAGYTRSEPGPIKQAAAWQPVDLKDDHAVAAKDDGNANSKIPAELGLIEVIEESLSRNPDLVALRQTEGVNRAIVDVAGTYPFNPTVQTRILPYARQAGANLPVYNYVLLWQQFELAHQRRFREQNASATLNATRWNIQQAEVQNAALTTQLYFTALYQHGLHELAELTAKLNDELLDVMEKRLKAGAAKAAAADVAMVRIDTRTSRQQALLAGVNYKNALLGLRRQLNLPAETPMQLKGDFVEFQWHPLAGPELKQLLGNESNFANSLDPAGLINELAARRPDVLAAQASADAGQANVRLARASRVPNLWFGPFYSRDSEAIANLGFQAQMDIPVLNTGRPLVRQREAELRQQTITREQLEAKARVEIRTALDRYEQARALCEQARSESGQNLPEELKKLEEQFKKGEIDILRIFQARNSLLLYRRTYLDSLNELALAAGVLAAAAGVPPAALVSAPAADTAELIPANVPPVPLSINRGAALLVPSTDAPR